MPPALAVRVQGHYQGPWTLKQLPRLAVRSRNLQQEWPPGAHRRANTGAPRCPLQAQPCSWPDPSLPSGLRTHWPPANSPPRFLFQPQLLPLLRRGTHTAKSCLGPTSCKQHSSPLGMCTLKTRPPITGRGPRTPRAARATWAGGVLGTCRLVWKPGHDPLLTGSSPHCGRPLRGSGNMELSPEPWSCPATPGSPVWVPLSPLFFPPLQGSSSLYLPVGKLQRLRAQAL